MTTNLGEIITMLSAVPIGFLLGYNIGTVNKTIKDLSPDPFRYNEYEKFLKNKRKDSTKDLFEYYAGMPGRFIAYKILGDPKNWE